MQIPDQTSINVYLYQSIYLYDLLQFYLRTKYLQVCKHLLFTFQSSIFIFPLLDLFGLQIFYNIFQITILIWELAVVIQMVLVQVITDLVVMLIDLQILFSPDIITTIMTMVDSSEVEDFLEEVEEMTEEGAVAEGIVEEEEVGNIMEEVVIIITIMDDRILDMILRIYQSQIVQQIIDNMFKADKMIEKQECYIYKL